jgi:hypothetical protein
MMPLRAWLSSRVPSSELWISFPPAIGCLHRLRTVQFSLLCSGLRTLQPVFVNVDANIRKAEVRGMRLRILDVTMELLSLSAPEKAAGARVFGLKRTEHIPIDRFSHKGEFSEFQIPLYTKIRVNITDISNYKLDI